MALSSSLQASVNSLRGLRSSPLPMRLPPGPRMRARPGRKRLPIASLGRSQAVLCQGRRLYTPIKLSAHSRRRLVRTTRPRFGQSPSIERHSPASLVILNRWRYRAVLLKRVQTRSAAVSNSLSPSAPKTRFINEASMKSWRFAAKLKASLPPA